MLSTATTQNSPRWKLREPFKLRPDYALASAWIFCENKHRTFCFCGGNNDGAQQGSIAEGPLRDRLRCAIWERGAMPLRACQMALAGRLRMSRLRRESSLRRNARLAPTVSVQRLPQTDVGAGGNDLRREQTAAAAMVQGHISPHAIQAGDVQHRTFSPARDHTNGGLEDEAQTRAGHARTKRNETLEGQGPNGRRLSWR